VYLEKRDVYQVVGRTTRGPISDSRARGIETNHSEDQQMNTKPTRKPFSDPFDDLSDEAFEREVLEALDQATTKISLRVPNELLGRTKHVAENRGVPYQSLMKALIDQGVRRLERVPSGSKRGRR
jgi:predicted DNA binding CopG/RHH family protein